MAIGRPDVPSGELGAHGVTEHAPEGDLGEPDVAVLVALASACGDDDGAPAAPVAGPFRKPSTGSRLSISKD